MLFGVVLSLYGYHTQIADVKKSHQHNGSNSKDTTPDNTPDTASPASQTQQQPPIPGAIQLSAKAGRFVALEALSIRVHDVDFDADPVKLFIRGDESHCFVYRADEYKYRTRRVSGSDKEK